MRGSRGNNIKKRSFSLGWIEALAIFLAVAPLATLLAVGYLQATRHVESDLSALATTSAQRATTIFIAARKNLETLALNTQGRCDQNAVMEMRELVFRNIYFREAGTVIDGQLACTDIEILKPAVTIMDPAHKRLADFGEIAIIPPAATVRPGKSIITNYKVSDRAYVNLLINPEIFNEFQQYLHVGERNGIFILSSDGEHIANVGDMDTSDLSPIDFPTIKPGEIRVETVHGTHYAVVRSSAYPVFVIASASNAYVIDEWKRNAYLFCILGIVLSVLLLALMRRLSGRAAAMDFQLRRAISRGEISVAYQPVVDMRTHACVGCEALLRWNHPREGNIPPAVFIPVAEQSDVIFVLTEWMMTRVGEDLAECFARYPALSVDINVCAVHFANRWIIDCAQRTLVGRIAMPQIIFELTERGQLASEDPKNLGVIRDLRASGARLSIDDFGVGYSNLSALQKIEFDFLKIDKAFIDGIEAETESAGLVDTVIAIGAASKTEMIAEGVEHDFQVAYLLARGVTKGQGFYFAKAMPVELFADFVMQHPPSEACV